ncbi:MAG: ArsR family transcriptional regulator, partial [Candidatus Micrarchaeaceae archaeon]
METSVFFLPKIFCSAHLRQLRAGNIVTERKSSADERSIYYSLDLEQFRALYLLAGSQLHPALTERALDPEGKERHDQTSHPPLRVLFLCTENSARSQMAEALLGHLSQGSISAYSAGSQPAERVHPLAVRVMEQTG